MLSYVLITPKKTGEQFTEFSILGLEGKATDYVTELRVGEEWEVTVGIINWEHQRVSYRVEVAIDGVRNNEIGSITLEHGGKWEGEMSFTPTKVGNDQKVEFLLHQEGKAFVKEQLYLWIDVKEPE